MKKGINNIKKIRESRGLSIDQLAKILGTSVLQIKGLETGERILSDYWINAISEVLNCTSIDLLTNESNYIKDDTTILKLQNLLEISKDDCNDYSVILPVLYPNRSKIEIYIHKDYKIGLYEICDKGRTIFNLQYTFKLDKNETSNIIKNILSSDKSLTCVQDIIFKSNIKKENLESAITSFAHTLSIKSSQITDELSKSKLNRNKEVILDLQNKNTR